MWCTATCSIDDLPHDGVDPIKKNKGMKISDSSGVYKGRNSASPELSNNPQAYQTFSTSGPPSLSVFVLPWPWCACINVGVPLDHQETAVWTALLCDLLLSAEIKAWHLTGTVSWPSCCRKVKSPWTCGAPGGVDFCRLPTWLRNY